MIYFILSSVFYHSVAGVGLVDITAQIKIIESLKCALLNDIAGLYEFMRVPGDERDGHLAALLTHTYLLAGRLGITYGELDEQVRQRLRLEAMAQEGNMDVQALLKHFSNER
jgi:hypothetical protein